MPTLLGTKGLPRESLPRNWLTLSLLPPHLFTHRRNWRRIRGWSRLKETAHCVVPTPQCQEHHPTHQQTDIRTHMNMHTQAHTIAARKCQDLQYHTHNHAPPPRPAPRMEPFGSCYDQLWHENAKSHLDILYSVTFSYGANLCIFFMNFLQYMRK